MKPAGGTARETAVRRIGYSLPGEIMAEVSNVH